MALEKDKPIGTALLIENDHEDYKHCRPWLAALYVDPDYRRKGVARKLVDMVGKVARDRGEERLFLYTTTPDIYRSMGWGVIESFGNESPQEFLMSIQLSKT